MEDKRKALYDALSGEYNLGTYEDFTTKLNDENKRRALYDAAGQDYNLGTYEEYSTKLGFGPNDTNVVPMFDDEPQVQEQPQAERGFAAGARESWKGLKAGFQNLWGETANVFTGSSQDSMNALNELNDMVRQGKDVTTETEDAWTDFGRELRTGAMEFLPGWMIKGWKDRVADKAEKQKVLSDIRDVLGETGGDVDKARALLEQRAQDRSYGDLQMEKAAEKFADIKPTEGFGAWVGSNAVQMVPSASALIVGAVTKSPAAAKAIGMIGMGGMTASTAGTSMYEAREAGASDSKTWKVGVTDGMIEYLTEKLPFDRYTSRIIGKVKSEVAQDLFSALRTNKATRTELENLLVKANERLGGKLFSKKNLKDYVADMLAEGASEFSAEALQTMTSMMYEEPENYPTINEILTNGWEGAKAGFFMGAVLGGASKTMEHSQNRQRRMDKGSVDIALVDMGNGEKDVAEVVEYDAKSNTAVILRDGALESVSGSAISDGYRFSFDEFEKARLRQMEDEAIVSGNVNDGQIQGLEDNISRDIEEIRALAPEITENGISAILQSEISVEPGTSLGDAVAKYQEDVARYEELVSAQKNAREAQRQAVIDAIDLAVGQRFWMEEIGEENEYGTASLYQAVEEVVFADGRVGYVVGYDDAGNLSIAYTDGTKGFSSRAEITDKMNSGEILSDTSMGLDEYLDAKIQQDKTASEQIRMQEEHALSVEEMIANHPQGSVINVGTEEFKIEVPIIAPPTADGVIVQMPDGTTPMLTWEDVAHAEKKEITPKTDAQINQSIVDEYRVAYTPVNPIEAAVPTQQKEEQVKRTSPANPLPLKADGTVDQTALWNKDPERWAQWNDEQRQDGGANSLAYVSGAIAKEQAKIAELQAAYGAEADFDARDVIEKEIADTQARVGRLAAIQQGYLAQPAVADAVQNVQPEPQTEEEKAKAEEQRRQPLRERAKELSNKLGVKVNIAEGISDVKEAMAREEILRAEISGGKQTVAGWFNPTTGEVTIYLPHAKDTTDVEQTFVHEVVAHKGIRGLLGEEGFNVLCDAVWDMMTEAERAKYMAYPGVNGDKRAAADEYIAHYAETMNLEESKPVWDRIMDLIMRILNSMGVNLEMTKDQLSDIIVASYQKLVKEAEVNAESEMAPEEAQTTPIVSEEQLNAPNSGEAQQIIAVDGEVLADTDGKGGMRFSIRTWNEGGRDYLAAWLANDTTLTEEEKADILARMDEFYKNALLYSDTYAPFGTWSDAGVRYDNNGNPLMSVIKANGDYAMILDFSLVCKKRRPLNRLLRTLVNRNAFATYTLRERELAEINWILQEHGFEVACALCFVDSKRYRVTGVADVFAALYNRLVKSLAPEGVQIAHFNYNNNPNVEFVENGLDTISDDQLNWNRFDRLLSAYKKGSVEHKVAQYLREHPEARKLVDATDFIEAEGFESVKENNPDLLKFYNMKKGTGGPKASFGDVQYLNDILKKEKSFDAEKAYAVGGVRLQPFSDFVPHMYFDYMQLFAELAAKKLPLHAYTKEVLFAKIFGLTGAKINMSLVPAVVEGGVAPGLDAEGNYAWADPVTDAEGNVIQQGQSFPYDEAMAIQQAEGYSKNCGVIAVGISDAHIEKMLDDPNIPFIIPYHKSSLNAIVARMTNIDQYKDYTNVQNTRKASGSMLDKGTKDFNFNEYLHGLGESGTPQQAAQAYLDWCRENNYKPKFSQFAYHPNYYKLLQDFNTIDLATGEYAPQGAVTMTFPTEESAFSNVEALIQQGLQEDAELEEKMEKEIDGIADQVLARLEEISKEPKMSEKQQAKKMAELADERTAKIKAKAKGPIDLIEEAKKAVAREERLAFRVISQENYEMAERMIDNLAGRPYFQRLEGEYELGKLASNYAELADIIMAIDANKAYTPVGTSILGFFAENPDMHFPLLFNDSTASKETASAFAEELSKVNDLYVLFFMRDAWRIHKTSLEQAGLGVKASSTTKYNKAIDARAEEIKAAEVKGTAFNFKKQESSLDEIDAIFKQLNKDPELALLHDKVMGVARKLGVKVSFAGKRGRTAGESLGDKVSYDYKYINSPAVPDQKKCNTITHELIHSITVYAIDLEAQAPTALTDGMLEAVGILRDVYNQIARDPAFKGEYGVSDVYEMVAELSNAQFRDKLKEKNLFQRILDALKKLLGIDTVKEDSAYQVLSDTLDYIIDNYDEAAFDACALCASKNRSYGRMMIQEDTLVPGHKKGQPMLSDAEMMADVSFRITKNTKSTIETWFNKAGVDPEMTEATINYLDFAFEDTTEQLCAAKWYLNGKIRLPDEDEYKVRDAVKVAKQNKVDALTYASPMDILNTFGQPKSKVKPIDPDTVKEFSNKRELAEGIVVYDVQDDFEGQAAVRKIIDTHWGEDANPWCFAARTNGDLERAKDMWLHYSKYPKRIAFRNGKLLAFYASANDKTWWDRNDEPHTNIPYSVKSKEGEYEVSTNYELKEGNKKAKKVSVSKSDKKGRTAYIVGNRLESAGIQDGERNLFYSSSAAGATLSDSTYGVGRSIGIQYGPYNVTQISFERRTQDEPTYYVRVGYGQNGVRAISIVEGARSWDIRYGINGDQIFVGRAQLNFDLTNELSNVYSGAYHMYRINDEEYEIARGTKKVGIVKKGEKVTMQMLEAFGEDGAPAGALLDLINDMGWNRSDYPYPNPADADLLRRDDEVREQIRKVENEINEIAGGRYLSSVPAIRFRIANENQAIFVSNAAKAVEAIKQEKATPEQWLKMIEKNGGLKAGEDKWMSLSDFLKSSDKKTLTKQEVLDFINENMIVIEETHYAEGAEYDAENTHAMVERILQEKFDNYIAEYYEQNSGEDDDLYGGDSYEYAMDKLREEMNDEFPYAIERTNSVVYLTFPYEETDDLQEWADKLGVTFAPQNPINETRLTYTTDGLTNKHEIALVVPTIESWNETDEVHFGDAGDGRAVAWIRFGETWERRPSPQVSRKVLVIDEIQSERHQEGREKGYTTKEDVAQRKAARARAKKATNDLYDYIGELVAKYPGTEYSLERVRENRGRFTEEENNKLTLLIMEHNYAELELEKHRGEGVPDAPFDKNWHELAMKRMFRYAAENGYDVVAWTKGNQQAERYNIGSYVSSIEMQEEYDGKRDYGFYMGDADEATTVTVDENGIVVSAEGHLSQAEGRPLADLVGKDMAVKMMQMEEYDVLEDTDLKVGNEGMKGFYDKMLPAFMNKYGKKWGVKVEDIELPNLENGLTMHSVPVTEEMKASVMGGQVMFRTRGKNESAKDFLDGVLEEYPYNTPAPISIVELDSKESLAAALGISADELSDEGFEATMDLVKNDGMRGGYEAYFDRIAIFAKDSIDDSRTVEMIAFHETVHKLNHDNPDLLLLGEYMWNNTGENTKRSRLRDAIKQKYDEEDRLDEMSAYVISECMIEGRIPQLMDVLDTENQDRLRIILNAIGYDTERETRVRSGNARRGVAGNVVRNTSVEQSEARKKRREGELTAEERRVINEYFPGAFPDPIDQARLDVEQNPTDAQKEAGNYKKGHLRLDGYNITIENPKGSVRRGTDSKGNAWENTLNNDYGYIRGTEGVDGDHIDVYLSDNPTEGNVFVIDQVNPETREFDEHKVMYGFNSAEEAREAYLANFSEGWNGLGTITEVSKDEFKKWIESSHRKTKPFSEYKSVRANEMQSTDESKLRYRVVSDQETLDRLNSEPTIKVYRAMQLINGNLYPPMSAKVDGELRQPIELGQWEEAEERSDLVDEKGRFKLDKGNKTSLKARYNPYFHTSPTPLNDQFSSAQTRPELVTVEVEVPESELTSGYKAEKAKDSVGKLEWKAGVVQSKLSGTRTVILSRWDKPVRIVPDSEVADVIVDMFEGKDITMPSNVVTPSLRAELEKRGVPFIETDNQGNPVEEVSFRVTGTPTDEVVANGLQLTPAQTAEVAANIFAALPEESRKKITEGLNGNILGLQDAILQIPTSLATKENWNDEDRQMANVVAEEMTKMAGEMTRPFSAPEALWLLYNNLNKDTDLISQASRALVQRNLGFDAETLAKQEQAKEGVRFRTVGDATSNAQASLYNKGAVNVWTRLKESFVDMQASVEELVKAIEKRTGAITQGFENVLLALNQQSSKGLAAMESYTQKFLNPMFDEIRRIMNETDFKYEDIVRHVILKHGLERNKKLAQRDAKAHYQEIYDDIISKISGMTAAQKRTYLTNAQLKEADAKAELATLKAVDMSAMTDEEKREHKKKLAAARKAVAEAEEHLKRAQKIASMSEQEAKDELDNIFKRVENGTDSVYKEMRENDYSGISSMFYDQLGVDRKNFSTEEQYQAALMEAKKDKYSSLADVEAAAEAEVRVFEGLVDTKELWKRINACTKETLRQQYEANMISKDQYENLRNMFEYYIPLRGFKDNTAEDMYTYYRKPNSTGYTKPILGAEGRKTEAESPFGWIASMAGSAIASNVKNEAKLALYYFVSNRPNNGIATISRTWFVDSGEVDERGKKIFKPAYPPFSEDLSSDEAKARYESWQENMRELQKKGQAYEAGQRLNLGNAVVNISDANKPEHIVNVKVGGKDYTIIINGNPRAAQAINGDLNIEGTSQDYSALFGPVLRWMSSVNTSYNPEFWITNMMRDMAFTMMAVNIKEDPAYRRKFSKNYLKAFRVVSLVAKNENGTIGDSYLEEQYKDFVKYGGVTGYTQIKDSETWEKEIENYLSSNDPESIKSGKVMRGMKSAFHAAHRFGESLEQVSRFAAFLTARETGKSINEAINDAKEITVNFNRKGSGKMITLEEAKYLTDKNGQRLSKPEQWMVVGLSSIAPLGRRFIMFFNAAIQGLNATYKLMKKNPKRFTGWALGYAAIGMMNALLHAMMDDDDDYLDIPQYERRNSLMIGGNGAYFKWALPQESRAFYALGDLAVETIMGRNPHQNVVGEALKIGTEILPVNPSEGWKAFMPSVAIPLIELAFNEDYKGSPIYNDQKWLSEEEKERTAKWSKAYQGTGWMYVKIAQGLNFVTGGDEHDAGLINLQPEKMEHLVQSAFGGTIRTADKFINTISAVIDPDEPWTVRQTPFLNRFLTINDERFKNVHVNDVFDYYKADAEHALTLEKQYIKDRDMDALTKLRSSDEYQWAKIYGKYKKPLKAIQEKIKVADGTAEKKELMKQQDELKKKMIKEISEL